MAFCCFYLSLVASADPAVDRPAIGPLRSLPIKHGKLSFYVHPKRPRFSSSVQPTDWIFSVDHKRIGLLYLYSTGLFFLVGVALGLLMRLELIAPGQTIVTAQTYNALFTLHGVVMIFLCIIPASLAPSAT